MDKIDEAIEQHVSEFVKLTKTENHHLNFPLQISAIVTAALECLSDKDEEETVVIMQLASALVAIFELCDEENEAQNGTI